MAGNLVKWWKHKILGGYKQFSVQECTTDSEELMYHQVRASSSCSAPPDLLLVSDRENNIPLRSPVVNIITTTTTTTTAASHASGSSQKQQQQQQQQQLQHNNHQQHQHVTKDATSKHLKISNCSRNSSKVVNSTQMSATTTTMQQQQLHYAQQQQELVDVVDAAPHHQQRHVAQQLHQHHHQQTQQQHGKEERIRLEEFTCDVSVEGGKSTQPLQFSFTFYDLDGHHGKITKDDIVGIVYTIYESIGKSVVVPHCGSKTINVRLTVSPEGKSKAAGGKLKRMPTAAGGVGAAAAMGMLEHATALATTATVKATSGGHGHVAGRRQHRYRPRKLIKSDDEDDDSNSDKEKDATAGMTVMAAAAAATAAGKSKSHASKYNKIKLEQQLQQQQQCCQRQQENLEPNTQTHTHMEMSAAANCQQPHDSLYENMTANLKCCSKDVAALKKCDITAACGVAEECARADSAAGGCVETATTTTTITAGHVSVGRSPTDVAYMKQASSRVKMLRKARKQKYQDHCLETRQRSLSVGNETCWRNRHLMQQHHQRHQQQQISKNTSQIEPQQTGADVLDGVQLRNPQRLDAAAASADMPQKRNSAECWKTALNRNDLISIIRESMEKNRLCFQLNGKPQANVSPIRQPQHHQQPQAQAQGHQQQQQQQHRQRSNTVSKIPTLIANHNNSIINHNSSHTNNNNNTNNSCSSNNQPPHIELSTHDNNSSSNSLYHPQPHIPIYHQQLAINPAVLAAQNAANLVGGGVGAGLAGGHGKMNLCGYDSFLHATICGGATSHSPPPPPAATTTTTISQQPTYQQQQLIATVQPIITVPNQQQQTPTAHSTPKMYTNQIKTSKILRSGSYSQTHHTHATQNSPQYHGYQRLSTSASAAHYQQQQREREQQLHGSGVEKSQLESLEKWLKCQKSKKDLKNYDNSIYAKLSEQLQESSLNSERCAKEQQRRRHRQHKRTQNAPVEAATAANSSSSNASATRAPTKSDYIALIPINGDPIECENLLGQTTDEETCNELLSPSALDSNKAAPAVAGSGEQATPKPHVATATLVDLNDEPGKAEDAQLAEILPGGAEADVVVAAQQAEFDTASACSVSLNSAGNASAASSLIHRYVHEHIHHHYHHFEDKEE